MKETETFYGKTASEWMYERDTLLVALDRLKETAKIVLKARHPKHKEDLEYALNQLGLIVAELD